MDEGDDSKIRRNLVVFSTLVLLVAWLDIPVTQLASGLLKTDKPIQPSPTRLWSACLAAHIYLIYRYFYTADFLRQWHEFLGSARSLQARYVTALLTREIELFDKDRKRKSPYTTDLIQAVAAAGPGMRIIPRSGEDHSLRFRFDGMSNGTDIFIGNLDVRVYEGEVADTNSFIAHRTLGYEITGLRKRVVKVRAYLVTLFRSQYTMGFAMPCVLTLGAALVILVKLYQSW